jgi:hypothetical protein
METYPDLNGFVDAVSTVNWLYTAEENGLTAYLPGSTLLPYPNSQNYIPYQNLTQGDVVGWLNELENIPYLDTTSDSALERIKNPTEQLPLPW